MERLLERLLCLAALSCCLSSASIHSLPFLSLNTSEVVNMTATNTDSNGFSPAISLPSPLPLGSRTVSSAYVAVDGFIVFESNTINTLPPSSITTINDIVIAPYWDDLALHQNQGYILYGTYGSLSVAAQEVNEFMSRNQSVLNFKTQWVLVAQWNNVCPYSVSHQPCGANSNSFQVVVATDGAFTVSILTYRCGGINSHRQHPVVGYHVSSTFAEQHTWLGTDTITNIDCINSPSSQWTNLIYMLNEVLPSVMILNDNIAAFSMASLNISCNARGKPLPAVKWYKDNVLQTTVNDQLTTLSPFDVIGTLLFTNVSSTDHGTYTCRANNSVGLSNASKAVELKEPRQVSFRSFYVHENQVNVGEDVDIRVRFAGYPRPNLSWFDPHGNQLFNNSHITITSRVTLWPYITVIGSTLSIRNSTYHYNGTFTCVASNVIDAQGNLMFVNKTVSILVLGRPDVRLLSSSLVALISKSFHFDVHVIAYPAVSPQDLVWSFTGSDGIERNVTCDTNNCSFSDNRLSLTLNNVSFANEGLYRFTAKNRNGVGNVSFYLSVETPTLIASPPSNASYLEGTNVTLSCTTLGLPLPIISWQRQCQGSSLTPIQTTVNEFQHQLASGVYRLTSDLVLHNVTHQDDSCYYHCNARSKATLASNTDSAVAIVTIQSPPQVKVTALPLYVLSYSSITLQCIVSGYPVPSVQWYKGGLPLSGGGHVSITYVATETQNVTSLVMEGVAVVDMGVYTCKGVNELVLRRESNKSLTLTVFDPATFTQKPSSVTVLEGESLQISCAAIGYPVPSIEWSRNAGNGSRNISTNAGSGGNHRVTQEIQKFSNGSYHVSSLLELVNTTEEDGGRYACSVSNGILGTKSIRNETWFNISIWIIPTITITNTPSIGLRGQPFTIHYNLTHSSPPVSDITWLHGSSTITTSNHSRYTLTQYGLTIKYLEFSDAGMYTVTVTNKAGNDSSSIRIIVEASPNVTAAPVQSVLITDNATLTCSIIAKPTNFTAAWYHNNIIINEANSGKYYSTQDLSSSVLIITNVTLEDAGAYRCLVSNRHGNGSSTTMLRVQKPLEIVNGPVSSVAFLSQNASLNCSVSGYPLPTVTWWKSSGGNVSDSDTMLSMEDRHYGSSYHRNGVSNVYILHVYNVTLEDEGSYYCSVRHQLVVEVERVSSTAKLIIANIPVITHSSSSVFSLVGETVILQCMFNGLPRPTLVWRYKDQVISGNSSNHSITNDGTLLISGVGLADAGQYYCSVSNGLGSDNIVTSLHVQAPPVFISQPASNALIVGTKQQLHCSCSGHPLPTIQWRKNNALLNDANINVSRTAVDEGSLVVAHSSLHFSPVTAHSIGDYSCICSNSLARNITISSSIGLVSVLLPPLVLPVSLTSLYVNASSSVSLTCFITGNPLPLVSWSKGIVGGREEVGRDHFINTIIKNDTSFTVNSTLTLNNLTKNDHGLYYCSGVNNVTNVVDYNDTASFNLFVQVSPKLVLARMPIQAVHRRTLPMDDIVITVNISRATFPPVNFIQWAFTASSGPSHRPQSLIVPSDRHYLLNGSHFVRLVLKGVRFSDNGTYSVTVGNTAGFVTESVHLNVSVESAIHSTQSPTASAREGDRKSFTCLADGIPAPSKIHWFRNSSLLDPSLIGRINVLNKNSVGFRTNISTHITGLESTLTINNIYYPEDDGYYYCRTFNSIGTTAIIQPPFNLQVTSSGDEFCNNNPCTNGGTCTGSICNCPMDYTGRYCEKYSPHLAPPRITVPPDNTTGDLYGRVVLTCEVSGMPQPRVTWFKDGREVTDRDQDEYSYVIRELSLSDRGFYQCQARSVGQDGTVQMTEKTLPAVVNIKGIVQYEASLYVPEARVDALHKATPTESRRILQEFIDEVNEIVAGRILAGGNELFFIEMLARSQFNASDLTVPVLLTIITQERGSYELLVKVRDQLKELNIGFKSDGVFDRFDGCASEAITIPSLTDPSLDIILTWPETNIGEEAMVVCPCGGVSLGDRTLFASRYCGGNFTHGKEWSNGHYSSCDFTDRARRICKLASLPPPELVKQLVSENVTDFDSREISVISSVLISAQEGVIGEYNASEGVFEVTSNIAMLSDKVLYDAEFQSRAPSRLLANLEVITNHLPLLNKSSILFNNYSSFVIEMRKVNPSDFSGETFKITDNKEGQEQVSENVFASIRVPSILLDESNGRGGNDALAVSSIYHRTDSLFVRSRGRSQGEANSVISATLVNNGSEVMVKNLSSPVVIQIKKPPKRRGFIYNPTCSYWNATRLAWSSEGCRVVNNTDQDVICLCDHLTNFAALLDISPEPTSEPIGSDVGKALNALSYIGIIVSLFCLLITIITYLKSRKLRRSDHGQLLLNLCFALVGLYLSYILSLHSPAVKPLCAIASLLLQYFLLVSFCAMATEALNLYIKLVIVLGKGIHYYVLKAALFSWVTPFFVVIFCFAPAHKNYITENFCRAQDIPFYIGTIVPFGLIYIFNWIMFILIMVQLAKKRCRKKFTESYSEESGMSFIQQLMIAVTLSVLFGLGWGLGLMVSGVLFTSAIVRNIFAVTFILLTGFQGLFIFIMHCLRSPEVRKEWRRWIFRVTGIRKFEPPSSMTNSSVVQRRRTLRNQSSISKSSPSTKAVSIDSDDSGPITENTVELIGKALDDVIFPVPPLELTKARELFPSTTSSSFGDGKASARCIPLDNPFDYSTCDETDCIRSPLSPLSQHQIRHLNNPLTVKEEDGVINDDSSL